jgi:hypothetical protein
MMLRSQREPEPNEPALARHEKTLAQALSANGSSYTRQAALATVNAARNATARLHRSGHRPIHFPAVQQNTRRQDRAGPSPPYFSGPQSS